MCSERTAERTADSLQWPELDPKFDPSFAVRLCSGPRKAARQVDNGEEYKYLESKKQKKIT